MVTRRGWALFVAMCVIWGIPYLLIKVAVRDLDPVVLVFARTTIGGLVLLPVAARHLRPLFGRWWILVAYTVVEIAIPWVLLSHAELRLSSSLTGLLVAAVPLIGAVLGWLTRTDDRIQLRRLAGLLLGVAGVGALVGFDVAGGDLGAVAEIGVVVIGYAIGPVIIARSLSDLPALGVIAGSLLLCGIGYAPFAVARLPQAFPPLQTVAAVLVLAVVCTALAFVLFFKLIAEVGPGRSTVITYVNPAVAVALGVVFLKEPFTIATGAGFVLILAGSYLATRRSTTPTPILVTGECLPQTPAP